MARNVLSVVLVAAVAAGVVTGSPVPASAAPLTATSAVTNVDSVATSDDVTPAFIQEGMPASDGGILVPRFPLRDWTPGDPARTFTAVTTELALGTDGRVVAPMGSGVIPDLPEGLVYTGIASDGGAGLLLRSDGQVVASGSFDPRAIPALPDGLTYTAVAAGPGSFYVLRSDGRILGFGSMYWTRPWEMASGPSVSCGERWVPPAGTAYTAIALTGNNWSALRSDGVVVSCLTYSYEPGTAYETRPVAGTAFVGVTGTGAARSDGVVVNIRRDGSTIEYPVATPGRSIVGLHGGYQAGVAILDDGTVTAWGDRPELWEMPPVPEGPGGFVAVGSRFAIWTGSLVEVPIRTVVRPSWRQYEPVSVEIEVGDEGFAPDGIVWVQESFPDGTVNRYISERTPVVDGRATVVLKSYGLREGGHLLETVFVGPPGVAAPHVDEVLVRPRETPIVGVHVPAEWWPAVSQTLEVTVTSGEGFSTDGGTVHAVIDGVVASNGAHVVDGRATLTIRRDTVAPGLHELVVRYERWDSPVGPGTWTGPVEVLEPVATTTTAVLPSEWTFGDSVSMSVSVVPEDPSVNVDDGWILVLRSDGTEIARTRPVSGSTVIALPREAITPVTGDVVVRYLGTGPIGSSVWKARPTVHRAALTLRAMTDGWQYGGAGGTVAIFGDGSGLDVTGSIAIGSLKSTALVGDGTTVTFSGTDLAPGRHVLTVSYRGNSYFEPAQTTVEIVVTPGVFTGGTTRIVPVSAGEGTLEVLLEGIVPLPQGVAYQWYRDGVAIDAARAATYAVTADDEGHVLTASTTASAEGYSDVTRLSDPVTVPVRAGIEYRAHVQNLGWLAPVTGGQTAGTEGRSLRVEALRFGVTGGVPGGIEASAHVQNIGWQPFVGTGGLVGTEGQSLRVEAFRIRLTGQLAERCDVYYRTHAQNFGWLGWAKNGGDSGTAGYAYRLEAVQVVLVPKGSPAPSGTGSAFHQR